MINHLSDLSYYILHLIINYSLLESLLFILSFRQAVPCFIKLFKDCYLLLNLVIADSFINYLKYNKNLYYKYL